MNKNRATAAYKRLSVSVSKFLDDYAYEVKHEMDVVKNTNGEIVKIDKRVHFVIKDDGDAVFHQVIAKDELTAINDVIDEVKTWE